MIGGTRGRWLAVLVFGLTMGWHDAVAQDSPTPEQAPRTQTPVDGTAELEVSGTFTPGLGLRGGYSWTDTEITRDSSGFVGFDVPNAPPHKAQLWMSYRFPSRVLNRLMVAGGAVRASSQFTSRDNLVEAPGFTRFDASASYELAGPRLTVGLVAQNLTNRRYVTSGAGTNLYAAPLRRLAVQLRSAL
jgi:outer membrane receptor protein involved in Fe transport